MDKKILVAYFSCTGTTKKVASDIAKATNGTLFEIKPEIPYTYADLNWMDKKSRSTIEMKDPASRPAIANKIENLADYNYIFIGFPIWWYVAPTIINTFIESYNFAGKTIIPFCTSGGSGVGKTDEILHSLCDDSVNWRPCKLLNGNYDLDSYISDLNL